MSGHSKWSKIKRKKGATDAKRSKIFSRVVKEIHVAVKTGDNVTDPNFNPRLRLAITNAKGANMPKDTVDRAIKKAAEDGGDLQEATYEGFAPGGAAILIECTTDNHNRTVANIRSYFTKHGGSLGTNGSVDFMFSRKGVFSIPKSDLDEEEFTMEIIDGGADEIELDDGYFSVTTSVEDFGTMQKKLEQMGIEPERAGLERIPETYSTISLVGAKKALRLIDRIEEDEDVDHVYHNIEMTEELLNELE